MQRFSNRVALVTGAASGIGKATAERLGSEGAMVVCADLQSHGVEETAKLLPFLIFAIRFEAFDENLDGIIYASFIALGFAAMENLHYLQFLTQQEILYRGFAGPVVHIVFASVWGYYIGIARLRRTPLMTVTFTAVTAAALLHGAYDFIVIALPISALPLSAALIIAIWIWRLVVIRRLKVRAGHVD